MSVVIVVSFSTSCHVRRVFVMTHIKSTCGRDQLRPAENVYCESKDAFGLGRR